ncbi:MAG: hypothetical protein H6653_19705, partial [Ardenticatenaceae bacterium]|nr:hypothetical protein [Ardenticatenaceae bacterium]
MIKRVLPILFAATLPLLLLFSLPIFSYPAQTVQAQTSDILVDKQLQRTDPVVRVGETLTFTIRIENQSAFTVTTLPLSDTFNIDVLGFANATPAPDSVDPATGRLDWTDLTTFFGDLPPGQVITVVTEFIAEHPATAIVNQAAVHDAQGNNGDLNGGDDTDNSGEAVGGSLPLEKRINEGITPTLGMPITFTISITNDGAITVTVLPLTENYDPAVIQFSNAVPPPDLIDEVTGILTWTDITTALGDLPAFGSVDVSVVFTALVATFDSVNEASISGAVDWFDNDLAGGADQVPITIIDDTAPTATPNPTNTPQPGAPAPTSTPTPTATATAVPAAAFPDTGIPPTTVAPVTAVLALIAALLPGSLWLWRQRRRRT